MAGRDLRRRRLVATVVATLSLAVLLPASPVVACQVEQDDRRDMFERADAAVVAVAEAAYPSDEGYMIQPFRVTERLKGDVEEDVLEFPLRRQCGEPFAEEGYETGLLLHRDGDRWTTSEFLMLAPDDMRAAAAPLPAPTSEKRPAVVIGGAFGDRRMIALDDEGEVVSYGGGDGMTFDLAVCAGGRRLVAGYSEDEWSGSYHLAVYSLPQFSVVRKISLPLRPEGTNFEIEYPRGIVCDGKNIFATGYERSNQVPSTTLLLRIDEEGSTVITRSTADYLTIAKRNAFGYDADRKAFVRVALDGGEEHTIGRIRRRPHYLVADPSEQRLAYTTVHRVSNSQVENKLHLIDVATGALAHKRLGTLGEYPVPKWMDRRHVVVFSYTSRVFNLRLQEVGRFEGWSDSAETVVRDGHAYGINYDYALKVSLPNGPVEELAELPTDLSFVIRSVP